MGVLKNQPEKPPMENPQNIMSNFYYLCEEINKRKRK